MRKYNLGDVAMIGGALIILIWALLKSFEIIHSPTWSEMVPYLGGVISIMGASYQFGKIMHRIESTEQKVDKVLEIEQRFLRVENEHNLAMTGKMKFRHVA
jgi:hypothetical protein